jgi:hypothetical protein
MHRGDDLAADTQRLDLGVAPTAFEVDEHDIDLLVAESEIPLVRLAGRQASARWGIDDGVRDVELSRHLPHLGLVQVEERLQLGRVVTMLGEVPEHPLGPVASPDLAGGLRLRHPVEGRARTL